MTTASHCNFPKRLTNMSNTNTRANKPPNTWKPTAADIPFSSTAPLTKAEVLDAIRERAARFSALKATVAGRDDIEHMVESCVMYELIANAVNADADLVERIASI